MSAYSQVCPRLASNREGRYTCQSGKLFNSNLPTLEYEVIWGVCMDYRHMMCSQSPDHNPNMRFSDMPREEELLIRAQEVSAISLEAEMGNGAAHEYLESII